jgi:hypothetical protein
MARSSSTVGRRSDLGLFVAAAFLAGAGTLACGAEIAGPLTGFSAPCGSAGGGSSSRVARLASAGLLTDFARALALRLAREGRAAAGFLLDALALLDLGMLGLRGRASRTRG